VYCEALLRATKQQQAFRIFSKNSMTTLCLRNAVTKMKPLSYFDSHCHLQLDPLWENRHAVIGHAQSCGLRGIAVASTTPCQQDYSRIEQLVMEYPEYIHPSFGLHPYWIAKYIRQPIPDIIGEDGSPSRHEADSLGGLRREIAQMLIKYPNAGVGECGLDKRISSSNNIAEAVPMDLQKKIFELHLDLAVLYNRYIVCHCVGCWGALYNIIQDRYTDLRHWRRDSDVHSTTQPPQWPNVILHSCNGMSVDMAKMLIANVENVYFSFSSGNISPKVCDLIRCLPVESILVETDAPDQPLKKSLLTGVSHLLSNERGGLAFILSLCEDLESKSPVVGVETKHSCGCGTATEDVVASSSLSSATGDVAHAEGLATEEMRTEKQDATVEKDLAVSNIKNGSSPSSVVPLCEILSQFLGIDHDEFCIITTRNAERVFLVTS
jgi:Tat protein secretion system quality control protein TatD with DNase activity